MIIAHVVKENIVWVTDLVSPRGPVGRNPGTVAFGDALRKHNINGATIAGGHGTTTKQADIATALAANYPIAGIGPATFGRWPGAAFLVSCRTSP